MPRQYARLLFGMYSLLAVGIVGVLYATVGKKLINMGTGNGEFAGFLSDEIGYVDSLMPLLLATLILFIVIWLIISSAQEERTVTQRRRRP